MNNKISPVWMFCGFFLVTLLWAMEFDNRPKSRLTKTYNSGLVNSQVFEKQFVGKFAQPVSSGFQKQERQRAEYGSGINPLRTPAESVAHSGNNPGSGNEERPHRNSLLSDSTKRLINIANRHLPAQEQIPYMSDNGAGSPKMANKSAYGSDNLYDCFTDLCLNAMTDY